jgi:hypothetical protein
MVVGSSPDIESYPRDFLGLFDVIVLSRFETSSRSRAETLVKELAEGGARIIVDMTGAPTSPFSRQPKFLDVYGEPVLQLDQATLIYGDGDRQPLLPFPTEFGEWRGTAPQGADEELVTFDYAGTTGAAVARNSYGAGEVIFLGLNLIFHASETSDPVAVALLEELIGVPAGSLPADESIPLENYRAGQDGWSFDINLPQEQWVLFPVAHHSGSRVTANGQEVESIGIERLTLARMPAGEVPVQIRNVRTGVYALGYAATALGGAALLMYVTVGWNLRLPRAVMPGRGGRKKDAVAGT